MLRTVKGLRFCTSLQANKLGCDSFMNTWSQDSWVRNKRLSYSWHNMQHEVQVHFGSLCPLSSMDETGRWAQVSVVHTVGLHHCQKTQSPDSCIFYKGGSCKPDGFCPGGRYCLIVLDSKHLLSILEEDSGLPRMFAIQMFLRRQSSTKTVSNSA